MRKYLRIYLTVFLFLFSDLENGFQLHNRSAYNCFNMCICIVEYFIAIYCLTYFHFGAEQYATLFLKTYGQYNIRV